MEFEAQLIAEGKLLSSRQGKRSNVEDPFEESVKQLIQKNPALVKSVTEPDDEKLVEKFTPNKKPKRN
jgi:hypothetical protein